MELKTLWTATIAACAFALAGLAATGAFAADPGDDSSALNAAKSAHAPLAGGASNPPSFERADADGDGLIQPDEVYRVGVAFPMLDRNGDGNITRSEYLTGTAQYAVGDSQIESRQQASSE